MEKNLIIQDIQKGKTALGIEFGSTRIKAVLVGSDNTPIASGAHDWENQYENNIWTYSLDAIWNGLQDCYTKMAEDVKNQYGVTLTTIGALGFSAMMHGYMAFDKNNKLLVPLGVLNLEEYHHRGSLQQIDRIISVSNSAEVEHFSSVSGNSK